LRRPAEFQAVFDQTAAKVGEASFVLLLRPNGLGHARLGLVIAKKKVKLSVERNRFKRRVRESFRQQLEQLPPADIVFLARSELASLDNDSFWQALEAAWKRVRRKLPPAAMSRNGVDT
jgi:ribonuclease P protein component